MCEFCKEFEIIFGPEVCTPNMHMACHCMIDYGPLSAFWCFSFERYNGVLENMNLSWISPEKQMLTKLLSLQHLNNLEYSESEFVKAMIGITTQYHSKVQGSVKQSDVEGSTISKQLKFHNCPTNEIDVSMKEYYILARPLYQKVFDDTDMDHLLKMYEVLYPNTIVSFSRFYFEINVACGFFLAYMWLCL